jgi:hypothetical protein
MSGREVSKWEIMFMQILGVFFFLAWHSSSTACPWLCSGGPYLSITGSALKTCPRFPGTLTFLQRGYWIPRVVRVSVYLLCMLVFSASIGWDYVVTSHDTTSFLITCIYVFCAVIWDPTTIYNFCASTRLLFWDLGTISNFIANIGLQFELMMLSKSARLKEHLLYLPKILIVGVDGLLSPLF